MRQPRVPEYRENEGAGRYLKTLVLFLKDFCEETWVATRNAGKAIDKAQKGLDGISYPVTSVNKKTGDVVLDAESVGARSSTWTPSASDVGALPKDGTAAAATKLATARTIRTNLASTTAASFDGTDSITPGVAGTLPLGNGGTGATTAAAAREKLGLYDSLWSGSWSSGTITVPNTEDYNIYKIGMSGQGTTVLAVRQGAHIRGVGGYSTSEGKPVTYQFTATYEGNVWTFVACNNVQHQPSTSHNAVTNNTVTSIAGVV